MTLAYFDIDRLGPLQAARVHRAATGRVESVNVLEGAYFSVMPTFEGDGGSIVVESSAPAIVPGVFSGPGAMRWDLANGRALVLFARMGGSSTLRITEPRSSNPDSKMLVVVEDRPETAAKKLSLTRLNGSTCAINAPDTVCYGGNQTILCKPSATAATVFTGVPVGTQHLMLAGHKVGQYAGIAPSPDQMALALGGPAPDAFKIDQTNVIEAFGHLRDRLTAKSVIWVGGCGLNQNRALCFAAAKASGAVVVAPFKALFNAKFPTNRVEILGPFGAIAFMPDGTTTVSGVDFAALQWAHDFYLSPNS